MMRRRSTQMLLALGLALSVSACGGGDDDNAQPVDTKAATTAATDDVSTSEDVTTDGADVTAPDDEVAAELPPPFPEIEVQPTEAGPRPLLSWTAVEGAATYEIVVLDAGGTPYWAWSGTDSSVHLGGMENPDAAGAWVFEPLSWVVAARDAEGTTLAMSARADLLP